MATETSQPQCPSAPVIRRNGFQLCGRTFHPLPAGASRVEGSRLLELFFPERLRLKRDQKESAASAKSLFRKPFFAAQLRWYGIPFRSTATVSDLEQLLKDAVVSGQCEELPTSVIQLEKAMRRDHEPALKAWDQAVDNWNTEMKAKRDTAWSKCSSPAEQAEQDLQRFMGHYFLTNGVPDPAKCPKPMALYGFDCRSQLHQAAERVPGLETCSGGDGDMRTICIGWDRAAVWNLAREVGLESRRRKAKTADQLWSTAMEDHERLVQQVQNEGPHVNPKSIEPPGLQKSRGSYVIRCKEVAGEWPSPSLFTLDVDRGVGPFIAAGHLDLGYFQGTMLIALNETTIETYILEDESQESDAEEEVELHANEGLGSRRKKAQSTQNKTPYGRPPKKNRPPAHRLFIRLRGRETGEGEIQSNPRSGYLEFSDEQFTKFAGEIDLPYLSGSAKLEGFKISTSAKRRYDSWDSYSEAAHEKARVTRWL